MTDEDIELAKIGLEERYPPFMGLSDSYGVLTDMSGGDGE